MTKVLDATDVRVTFQIDDSSAVSEAVNRSGEGYLTPAMVEGRWLVRISIGAPTTTANPNPPLPYLNDLNNLPSLVTVAPGQAEFIAIAAHELVPRDHAERRVPRAEQPRHEQAERHDRQRQDQPHVELLEESGRAAGVEPRPPAGNGSVRLSPR